jgi:hypothetical protein
VIRTLVSYIERIPAEKDRDKLRLERQRSDGIKFKLSGEISCLARCPFRSKADIMMGGV